MVDDSIMYAEVFEILACMDKQEVMRIPVNILELIKNERSKTYKTRIDKNDLFNPKNIDQRSINLLTWLMIKFIADEEQKKEIIKIGKENDLKENEAKKELYKSNIFEKKENDTQKYLFEKHEEKSLIVEKNGFILKNILKIIRNFFKK